MEMKRINIQQMGAPVDNHLRVQALLALPKPAGLQQSQNKLCNCPG